MAIAAEAVEAGAEGAEGTAASRAAAAAPAPRQRSSAGDWGRSAQGAWQALPQGGASSPVGATITKLVWAVALGLIVLEIASRATGRFWSLNLPGTSAPTQPEGYAPLYRGQAQVGHSIPGVYPVTVTNSGTSTPGASSGGSLLSP